MPFHAVTLTSGQYNSLRGTSLINPSWAGQVYASLCPNTVMVACRVNGTPTGTSFAGFTYDSVTTGLISNVKVGMTIILSRDNNIRHGYFTGRIRELPTGSSSGAFYINETSAPILDNDYVFVIADYRLAPILGRDVVGFTVTDWDNVYVADPPVVVGLSDCYAGWVDDITGVLTLSFDISASYPTTSGASMGTPQWTLPASGTLISGTLTSNAITVEFDPSDGDWVSVTATDSGMRSTTRNFIVFAHDADHSPLLSIDNLSLTGDIRSGWSGDMVAFDEVDTVLDNTLICLWIDETFCGTDGALFASTNVLNNIIFTGRLRSERNKAEVDERAGLIPDVSFTLEGVGAQLARLYGALIAEINDNAPAQFDSIKDLTVWRGIIHVLAFYTNFLTLHDLTFDDTSSTFLCQGLRTQGGNLLDLINDLAQSINSAIEFAPSGETRVIRDPRYKSSSDRNSLLTLANWTTADAIAPLDLEIDHVRTIGRGDSSGGMYFNLGSINQVFPVLAIAPGMANDYPDGTTQLTRQVLAANQAVSQAQDELNERAGRQFAIANSSTKLTINHLDSHGWLVPSRAYWFTWTLDTDTNVRGRSYTTADRWLLESITLQFDLRNCTRSVQGNYVLDINEDTDGASGDSVIYPDPGEVPITTPPIPVIEPYPGVILDPLPDELPPFPSPADPTPSIAKNGNTVVVWSSTQVWTCTNFYSSGRVWVEVTPEGGATIRQCLFDPFPDAKGLWVLANDGADSFVYYCDNFLTPVWVQGESKVGVYTELRARDVAGGVKMAVSNGTLTQDDEGDYDFSLGGSLGWYPQDGDALSPGTSWGEGHGYGTFTGSAWESTEPPINTGAFLLRKDFASGVTPTAIRLVGNNTGALFNTFTDIYTYYSGSWHYQHLSGGDIPSGAFDFALPLSVGSGVTAIAFYKAAPNDLHQVWTITQIEITATEFPISDGITVGGSAVAESTDYAETWDDVLLVGDTPGSTVAFDIMRVGDVTLAGADAQAYAQTTTGAAFASLGTDGATAGSDPICLELPWGTIGSSTLDNWSTSTPDYLLGSAALVSSHCLWAVDGGGGRTGITPSGVTGMISNNCITTYFGSRAAIIGSVSGTRHVFTTTNLSTSPTWTDRGAVGSSADFIRPLRLSNTLGHLFWVDSTNVSYSKDYGATILTAGTPCTSTLLGVEVYG